MGRKFIRGLLLKNYFFSFRFQYPIPATWREWFKFNLYKLVKVKVLVRRKNDFDFGDSFWVNHDEVKWSCCEMQNELSKFVRHQKDPIRGCILLFLLYVRCEKWLFQGCLIKLLLESGATWSYFKKPFYIIFKHLNKKCTTQTEDTFCKVQLLTFPNFDSPLCSGVPPGLSTFEQSALKDVKNFDSKEALNILA